MLRKLHWTGFQPIYSHEGFKVNVGENYSTGKELAFSVPQGSCAGPILLSIYASTMIDVIPSDMDLRGYADSEDHLTKTSFYAGSETSKKKTLGDLEKTLADVKSWMNENPLQMDDSKTEFVMFGSRQQLCKLSARNLNVNTQTWNPLIH